MPGCTDTMLVSMEITMVMRISRRPCRTRGHSKLVCINLGVEGRVLCQMPDRNFGLHRLISGMSVDSLECSLVNMFPSVTARIPSTTT